MISRDSVYRIGRIGKPHGVHGEVTLQFDDDVFDRTDADYLVLELDGIMVPFFFEEYRFRNDRLALVKFEDVDSQQRAAQLTGAEVYFPRELAEGSHSEPSLAQLVGYSVFEATDNSLVGVVASVNDSTDNVLLELDDGTLIPVAEEWFREIDAEARRIVMSLPEGLVAVNS